jgi:hypothetical protein
MDKIQKHILILFSIILVIAAAVTFFSVRHYNRAAASGFTAPAFDRNARTGVPEGLDADSGYSRIEMAEGFVVALCGNLTADEKGRVDVYFTADQDNTVWVRLLLLSEEGEELGATGILKPGEYVQTVQLDTVPEASETITLKILSYEPQTYYSKGSASATAVLNIETEK